ncbi:unnamed protein product [Peronospora destructor]|uniref:CS domain-containing protein n=1 Tax=Peronospora destructor TaxID=86335 RepID=A0AAV0U4A7_9STRA|nr:unnamed protein product [Peronospora destructor]
MSKSFFVPYVDVSHAEVNHVKLVTPWGIVKLNKGFMEQLVLSVAVVVLTVMLWRCSTRLNETLKKKKKHVMKEALEEEEEEEEMKAPPDENMVKNGENCYYYSHLILDNKTTVSSYGWTDSKKTISIYLTDDAVMNLKNEQLKVKWTNMSLSMDLLTTSGGDRAKSLVISHLFQEITDVTWETNNDTLTIILTKAQEIPWTSLNGAATKMEDHIEYDDAFYE